MPRYLDLETWPRREHYRFFRGFDRPFFNITAPVDVTTLYRLSKTPGGPSFLAASIYLSLRAANAVEPFRYRLRPGNQPGDEGRVEVLPVIDGGSTILKADDTFTFSYFDFVSHQNDFPGFAADVAREIADIHKTDRPLSPRNDFDALIHYSVIPWVAFTSFAHARTTHHADSVPKIVFGRHADNMGGTRTMPVSVEVHHALVDGLHVGRFFEWFQAALDDPAAHGIEADEETEPRANG